MTKKLITLLLALTMVFACAVPSFAVTANSIPVVGGDSYYLQGSASSYAVTDAITVHVYINSGTYQNSSSVKYGPIDAVYDVTLTPTQSTTYSVEDVLYAINNSTTNTILFDMSTPDPTGSHQSWLHGVKDTSINSSFWFAASTLYNGSTPYYCGWMFRINGNIPAYIATVNNEEKILGYEIADAYVSDGDVINLYYSNIYNHNFATKSDALVLTGTPTLSDNTYSATFKAMQCQCYKDEGDEDWTLVNWSLLAGNNYEVLIDGVSYGTISTDGTTGCFTVTGLSEGTHTIRIATVSTKVFRVGSTNFPSWKVLKEFGLCTIFECGNGGN